MSMAKQLRLLLCCASCATVTALQRGRAAPSLGRRAALSSLPPVVIVSLTAAFDCRRIVASAEEAPGDAKPKFRRPPLMQYIAALGDPAASSGTGADTWGLWDEDPGPQGVRLGAYESKLVATMGSAPAGWQFDASDWWLEEHGLIMPAPGKLPAKKYDRASSSVLPARRYVVSGDRETTAVLTVRDDGRWELSKGTLYDVTHLPCRSARYTPASAGATCTPAQADKGLFPVRPGAKMPAVPGCAAQDYAVLFVLGLEV